MSLRKRTDRGPYSFTIFGEPASKSNSRRVVHIKGRIAIIKSKKARNYLKAFKQQCPARNPLFLEDVAVGMKIFYATRRPDLDESLILDAMQDLIYKNDRQVKFKIISWGLDNDNPRSEIMVSHMVDYKKVITWLDEEWI